ncbi:Yippee/Mis18 [Neocallimastix lanati (nom. inval.)]|jgi:hypothetical protein|nr:Yippee/Mis18 [Neocallimastix sp. JGI-2020a]
MGKLFLLYLDEESEDNEDVYCCAKCKTHLSQSGEIISKSFQGYTGKAWLFNRVVNIFQGECENRNMTTGIHKVADIYCSNCKLNVGWKYIKTYENSQKYKEGKYILEKRLVCELK